MLTWRRYSQPLLAASKPGCPCEPGLGEKLRFYGVIPHLETGSRVGARRGVSGCGAASVLMAALNTVSAPNTAERGKAVHCALCTLILFKS